MKKLLVVALVVAAFGLVGCASDKQTAQAPTTVSSVAKTKHCKKNCKHNKGKLGVEKTTADTTK